MGCLFCHKKNMTFTLADFLGVNFSSSAISGDFPISSFDIKNLTTDSKGSICIRCRPNSHWNLLFSVHQADGIKKCSEVPPTTIISNLLFFYTASNGQLACATLPLTSNFYNTVTKMINIKVNVLFEKVLNLSVPQNDSDGTYHIENDLFLILNSDPGYRPINSNTVICQQNFDGDKVSSGGIVGCKIPLN